MGGKNEPLPQPDPGQLASDQAQANRLDQITPFGSLTFSGDNRNVATLTPSAGVSNILNSQVGISNALLSQALGDVQGGAFDFGTLQRDFTEDAQAVEQATFDRAKGLLDPVFLEQGRALEQRLANQGLPIGSEAFEGEFDRFDRRRNEAFSNAALDSVQAGRQEQSRRFGIETGARSQMLNELQALLGAQQVQAPQLNSFFAPSNVDVLGANQLAHQVNAEQSQRSNPFVEGLFGLGRAAILA